MNRKGVPSVVAVSIVVLAMVVVLLGVGVAVGVSLNELSRSMPSYQHRAQEMLLDLKALAAKRGIDISDEVVLGYVNPGALMSWTPALFTALSGVLSNILLILFTVLFMLLETSVFQRKLRSALENPRAAFPRFAGYVVDLKRYLVIKTLINLLGGVLTAVWLAVLGVDYAILWGVLAFLLHFVPSVGSLVAAVPSVFLALIQLGGVAALLTAAGYLAIGTIIGNIIEPKIMGRRLGLSTLVVFVSFILWGSLLGLIGALLCVPLTMTVKRLCEMSEDTRWIAVLLGSDVTEARSIVSKRTRRVTALVAKAGPRVQKERTPL
jgi:predicted PurR-regulated permease PerM